MTGRERVIAATVTYGDRAETCIKIVRRAFDSGASGCVVVDNGSVDRSRNALRAFAAQHEAVHLIRLEHNEGSASGFSSAIVAARSLDFDRVWLLDDDNLPRAGALDQALEAAHDDPQVAIACLRVADPLQVAVVNGRPIDRTLQHPGSILGFDLIERLRPRAAGPAVTKPVEIPWAPYGGLLLPMGVVRAVAPPSLAFVLYGDDRDYCARMRAQGLRILLDPHAIVDDIVDRWGEHEASAGHLSKMATSGDQRRIFYLVRNTVFDDRRTAVLGRHRARLAMNAAIYTAAVAATAVRTRRPQFFTTFVRAAIQGARGTWYSEAPSTTS